MLTLLKFQEIYSRFQSSGLRVRDFCHNEGLHESKFYYWQKKLRPIPCRNSDFIPIVFDRSLDAATANLDLPSPVSPSSSCSYPCEIVYSSGTILRLSIASDLELLRKLLSLNP